MKNIPPFKWASSHTEKKSYRPSSTEQQLPLGMVDLNILQQQNRTLPPKYSELLFVIEGFVVQIGDVTNTWKYHEI